MTGACLLRNRAIHRRRKHQMGNPQYIQYLEKQFQGLEIRLVIIFIENFLNDRRANNSFVA